MFGIRQKIRTTSAHGLRFIAGKVRGDTSVSSSPANEVPPEAQPSSSSTPQSAPQPIPQPTPQPMAQTPQYMRDAEPVVDLSAMTEGLSGNMGPAVAAQVAEQQAADAEQGGEMFNAVVEGIRTVYDPEIPVNVYDLGLVYKVEFIDEGHVNIVMTLTSPNCPSAQEIPVDVERAVLDVRGIERADVEVVFDPPWGPELMSDEAKLSLNML